MENETSLPVTGKKRKISVVDDGSHLKERKQQNETNETKKISMDIRKAMGVHVQESTFTKMRTENVDISGHKLFRSWLKVSEFPKQKSNFADLENDLLRNAKQEGIVV